MYKSSRSFTCVYISSNEGFTVYVFLESLLLLSIAQFRFHFRYEIEILCKTYTKQKNPFQVYYYCYYR